MTPSQEREVARLVLFQRSDLLRLGRSRTLRRVLPLGWLVGADAWAFRKDVLTGYREEMRAAARSVAPLRPERVGRVLDIGCGIGGVHEFLWPAAGGAVPDLWLADRDTARGRVYYGFHAEAAAYNRLGLTRDYLVGAGLPEGKVHLVDVASRPLPDDAAFDLVMSLISWGFHYPVETYLEYVATHLAPGGRVVLDCRRGTDGRKVLEGRFAVEVVEETAKYDRVVCRAR